MNYCELLAQGIEKSGLTYDEIEARTIEHGVRVSKSYLSFLKSGKQAPPSPEMSRVLETVLDMPEGTLVWRGYMERAPKEVQERINTLEKRIADLERQLQDRPMSPQAHKESTDTVRRGYFGKEV